MSVQEEQCFIYCKEKGEISTVTPNLHDGTLTVRAVLKASERRHILGTVIL